MALWALRIGVALSLCGVAAQALLFGSPVFSWFWLEADLSEAAAMRIDRAGAFALLACVPLVFSQRAWVAPAFGALWLGLITACAVALAPRHPWLTVPSQGARVLGPLALALWARGPNERMLRVAAAMTFAGHGIEALLGRGLFIDYLLSVLQLSQPAAEGWLRVIGCLDLACAAAILLPRRLRHVALWMAAWGFATACMRIYFGGWGAWPETLMRMTNAAVPLTLYLLWRSSVDSRPTLPPAP